MLRVVSPGELETCTCASVEHTVCIEPEEYPRCFECLRPVRQYHALNVESRWVYLVWTSLVAREESLRWQAYCEAQSVATGSSKGSVGGSDSANS